MICCTLTFLQPHQIYRKDVDNFVPGVSIPPKCELLVEWDPKHKNKKPVRLRHKINLIGASKPFNFFNLSLNPTWKDGMPVFSLICTRHYSSTQIAVVIDIVCFPIFQLQLLVPKLNSHV